MNELILTKKQEDKIDEYVVEIIKELPAPALNELLGGYGNDIEKLISSIREETRNVTNMPRTLETEKFEYLSNVERSMDMSLRKLNYNYFKVSCLPNFRQGWRNIEWGNLFQLHKYVAMLAARSHGKSYETCFAFPLWRLYSYDKPMAGQRPSIDNQNRKETCLITNTETLGRVHLSKVIEEIRANDILREKINPNGKANLAATSVTTESGSIIHLRGKDGMIRGLHCGSVICDDLPDESSLYSQEQRDKLREVFYGSISPVVEPGGYFIISGTPYSDADLYADIRKDPNFKLFEYPCVFPDGRLLSPDRFDFHKLNRERHSLGTIVFSREYLVQPISDSATIFPYEFLKRSIHGMEHITFAQNIESYPFKMKRVVIGCDFAISGNVGSDSSVFSVWGIDKNNLFHLLNYVKLNGASHDLQVNKIIELNARFKPSIIVFESNGFQRILADLARDRGLRNIREFKTNAGNKKNLRDGLPSLSALFENGSLRVPYGDENTRRMVDSMFGEFNSIAINPTKGTLEASLGHDDICMSSFFAINELREKKSGVIIDLI